MILKFMEMDGSGTHSTGSNVREDEETGVLKGVEEGGDRWWRRRIRN